MTAPQNPRVTLADRAGQLGKWFAEYAEHHKAKAEQMEALPGSEAWAKVERNLERARFAYTLQDDLAAAEAASKAREAALVEALTPSGDTKAAYHGEFSFQLFRGVSDAGIDQYEKVYVPWTTVKEIMAAISARAALTKEPDA